MMKLNIDARIDSTAALMEYTKWVDKIRILAPTMPRLIGRPPQPKSDGGKKIKKRKHSTKKKRTRKQRSKKQRSKRK